ncbi:MAG: GFA family protein, partial [Rhodocyclaceae bacterium]
MIRGACHCGACRDEIELDTLDDIANCHCTICRRTSGAPLVRRQIVQWQLAMSSSVSSSISSRQA